MQYPHSPERSAELLRQALPLMSRQIAALHPMSYALWYAYVANPLSALRSDVDQHLSESGPLDEHSTAELFRRHLGGVDEGLNSQVTDGLQRLIGGMSSDAARASDQTSHFDAALQRMASELVQRPALAGPAKASDPPLDLLEELLAQTREMQSHMATLQSRLTESRSEIERLRGEVDRARAESLVDPLTGLANRRAFDERLAALLRDAAHGGSAPCLLMVDLDHFKRINDQYGHGFGDQVLRATAQVLSAMIVAPALSARVGGEEFALLLPSTTADAARGLGEKVRAAVAAARIRRKAQGQTQTLERVTLSIGAAIWRHGESADSLVDRADRALYSAKSRGRDRVEIAAD